jgi:hypothetical protein
MSEPRAQRTLVKSPPELWAEISDVSTLARHLGEFGDIRITRLEAETTVVWEGDRARGTVNLEPSGWGTKVTMTAEAIAVEAEAEAEAEAEPAEEADREAVEEPALDVVVEPEPEAVEAEPEAVVEAEPEAVVEAEPEAVDAQPQPRKRGFFARLLGRRAKPAAEPEPVAVPEPEPVLEAEPVAAAPEAIHTPTVAAPEPEPVEAPVEAAAEPIAEPELDGEIAAGARAALDAERVEAVLVGVLDDLGSAHHRPFSRG